MGNMTAEMVYTKPVKLWDTINTIPQFCSICDPDDRKPYAGPYELEKHVMEKHSNPGESMLTQAISHFHEGRYAKAQGELDKYFKSINGKPLVNKAACELAYRYRGKTYFHLSVFTSAYVNLKRADKLKPDQADTLKYLGATYFELEQYEDACINLKDANKLQPNDVFTLSYLGASKAKLKLFGKALVDLNRALEMDSCEPFVKQYRDHAQRMVNATDKKRKR
jgi:tetratricopeptide (TPR) repeat protein